jgi:hypothetical protein
MYLPSAESQLAPFSCFHFFAQYSKVPAADWAHYLIFLTIRNDGYKEVSEPRAQNYQVIAHVCGAPDAYLLQTYLTQVFRSYFSEPDDRN